MRNLVDVLIVLCVIVGAYALLTLIGVFPDTTAALVLAGLGAFGGFLYGRYGRRGAAP